MKAIELFAGVGGFRIGLERNGHEVIWSNEWDKYAADTYDKNFGGQINRQSITDVRSEDIPEHDLIVGGFPCQSFSIAGKRRGMEETRGTLFFEIMRIARHHKTKYLFLENVKGLLNHDEGRTFETILRSLDECGYDVQWQVLNSKNFGVPQNRERVFIIGHLRGESRPKVFPIYPTGGENPVNLKSQFTGRSVAERVYDPTGLGMTLSALGGGGGAKTGLYDVGRQVIPVITPDRVVKHQNGRRFKTDGEPSFTINAQDRHGVMVVDHGRARATQDRANALDANYWKGADNHGQRTMINEDTSIRRLTPLECERLQGFPDGWTAGVSDTQRYKQMGNAVTVNVIEVIANKLC
jgi:DNA (cytosine-5)-methyltransferase 1